MKKYLSGVALGLMLSLAAFAQQQPAQAPANGPKPKSQKELQALQKVQAATTPTDRMAAIDNVLENFTDTDYKHILLDMAIQSAQQARDPAKVEFYADRALKDDPKDATAQLAIASATVENTKEYDLDKDQKLAKVEKNANAAIESLKTEASPNPQLPADQWEQMKKAMTAEAYADLGQAALLQKKYDVAIQHYKTAADQDPEPAILIRLASAYNQAKQPDNASATCDRILAAPNLTPQIKQLAQQVKADAQKLKAAGAK
jgi:tetratricopeptide (TPR) repeat protein